MRKYFLIYLLLSCSISLLAQQKNYPNNNFQVSGKIVDAVSKQAIEYATITLQNDSTKKIVTGAVTDKKGQFILENIAKGNFTIIIQFIGYSDKIKKISINANLKLEELLLDKKTTTLDHVTVTSTKQAIENKIDKLVYNVEKDVTSQGGVATDALKKIPMVTVDADGNVELLGNPSIRFLIDGKPSAIFGNSVADALQSIPNSQIQSIEVITSPSAKYDATGTGGIINIILKKNKIEGFNGNINLSAGTRLENGNLNLNWKKNKIGLNAYFGGNAQLESLTPNGMDRLTTFNNGSNRLVQVSENYFNRNGYKTGIGMDWSVSKNDNITANIGYNHFGNKSKGLNDQTSYQYDLNGTELSRIYSVRNFQNTFDANTFDNSISYKRKFKKEKQELDISYSGSFGKNTTYYNQSQNYKSTNNAFAGSYSLNPGNEDQLNFSVDYAQPVNENFLIETGFKHVLQSILSNADVYVLNAGTGLFAKDNMQSYASEYHRKIYAGYVAASFSAFHFFDVKAGGRFEYTTSTAQYSNAANTGIPDYHNLAPSFVLSHTFVNRQTVKFSYSYRIERPDFRDLNPFMNMTDPHNIITGNPNLQPEIGGSFELGYNRAFENGSNINVVFFYQHQSPDIKPFITYYPTYKIGDSIYNDVTVSSRANISSEVKAGMNVALSLVVNKQFTIRPNFQIFNRSMDNPLDTPSHTSSVGFRTNLNAAYVLPNQWTVEVFGNYNLGMKWQGKQPNMYSYTIAARKQLFKNKGSIGVVIVNAFNQYIHQDILSQAKNLVTNSYRDMPYRSLGISFTYKFGKLKFTKPKESENYLYTPPTDN
jgi:outer membrane receptor protein involved in Fe transport